MEAIEAILSRRSVRKYTGVHVTDEQVKTLLEAAMAAPSAHNKQPWHFIIVKDRETLLEIPKFHPYSKMLEQASLAIVVCGDLDLEEGTGFWVQDCSAATENILIAAKAIDKAGNSAVYSISVNFQPIAGFEFSVVIIGCFLIVAAIHLLRSTKKPTFIF